LLTIRGSGLRRGIVERLGGGTATVGEVTRDFAVSMPTISRHLKTLEEAGVGSRDRRPDPSLRMRPETLADASDWIESKRERWQRLFDVAGEYREARA
jgi:DNA-binding transcriptional ArsR family regulator